MQKDKATFTGIMRSIILVFAFAVLTFPAVAQVEVRSLKPTHKAALAAYLNKHKNCDFMPESLFGKDEIKMMKHSLGSHFQHPYYIVGDFNRDGIMDFAMVLSLSPPTPAPAERIVVWNGMKKGGFRVAWQDDQSTGGFLSWTWENKKTQRLAYGKPESDVGFIITPAGNSYIPEGDSEGDVIDNPFASLPDIHPKNRRHRNRDL